MLRDQVWAFTDQVEHDCEQQCESAGVCEIAAEPHSIQSSFQGMS